MSRDFEPTSPYVTFKEFYSDGDQAWYDPDLPEYIPHDHMRIYECIIQNIPEPFEQEHGIVYWLGLCITTVDSPPLDSLLGWKTADLDWYPADYCGRHVMDDAVWGGFPLPIWDDLRYPAGPDSGASLDLAFVISSTIFGYCWDWLWKYDQWCGPDAFYVAEKPDMTHDCWVNMMDFCLFARSACRPTSRICPGRERTRYSRS